MTNTAYHGGYTHANNSRIMQARNRLQTMLAAVGKDVVYCDTDSIKAVNPGHNERRTEGNAKNNTLHSG